MKYKAFISYRHCELDSEAAKKIIKAVETYGIPKTIEEKHHTGKHVGKLFRDEDELAAADNLSVVITEALDGSEYFIMVCSPRYIESEWCMLELRHWINRNGRKNIIAVLVEGEPNAAFPKILTDYSENGKQVHIEPLAVDIRGANQREVLKNIDIQKFRIISSLIGCDYDDLRQRQHERTKKNTIGILAGVFSLFAVILTVVLGFNFRLNEQNKIIADQYSLLEASNNLLENTNSELEAQKNELEDKNKELAETNISLFDKMAELDMLSGNRIAASARELLAYRTAEENKLDTSDIFNELVDYSDIYTDLAKKVKSTSAEQYRYNLKCGNERYFQIGDYFYDVLKNEPVYYLGSNYSYTSTEYLHLEGSKFASVYVGNCDIYDNNSPYGITVRVFDVSDGSEKEYKYEFTVNYAYLNDCFTYNGDLIVYTKYWVSSIDYYDIFVFDYECNLKNHYSFTSEEAEPPKQILTNETLLYDGGVYNFATGEKTEFEIFGIEPYIDYGFKHSHSNKVSLEYDSDTERYVFSEKNFQYEYAALFGDYIVVNYVNNIYMHNMQTGETETAFDEDVDRGKIRFSVSDSGSVLAYSDDEKITLRNKNGATAKYDISESGGVMSIVVNDNYLVVLYFGDYPTVYYFDSETMEIIQYVNLSETTYNNKMILCGNVLHIYSKAKNLVDTYYLNDLSGYKAVNVSTEENKKYDFFKREINYSIGDDFVILAYNNDREYVTPMLYIFDSNEGKLLGNFEVTDELAGIYESSSGEITYQCPYLYDGYIRSAVYYKYGNEEKHNIYLADYKDLLNSDDSAESHMLYVNYYKCSSCGDVACVTQCHEERGTFDGAIYKLPEWELVENVEFFNSDTKNFYVYQNIRVESGDYGIKIYDGDKLVNSFDAAEFYTCNDPGLITMRGNDRWVIFSLSQNKEMMSVEFDEKNILHKVDAEGNGSNYILFEYRYLVDTEKFEIVHDFGDNSPVTYENYFIFNEYLGMWEFGIEDIGPTEVVFFYPDTFEKAFSVDKITILSSNGKYFYKLDRAISKKSDESRALWQIPFLKIEDVAENIEEMLNDFGITEDDIKALDTM